MVEICLKIIIAGGGKVGATLTRQLSAEGYDLTLMDKNTQVLESVMNSYDVMAVRGNCATMGALHQAGVEDADLLIAVTNADEVNLLCCMTAHAMNPKLHTIARIRNPEYSDQIYKMRDAFGLSLTVNPEKQAAVEIERLLKYPGFLRRETFAKGRVEIVELRISEKSKLCNVALGDLSGITKCRVLVCAVLREGTAIAPSGNFVLRQGDRIFVTAPTDRLTVLLRNLGVITRPVRRVILCGGGRVSYYLASLLQKDGVSVQLIEHSHDRCVELAGLLPDTCIVHGDASSQALLENEGISQCDALVTMTGLDELNMIISLYGSSRGVPQIITKLGHMTSTGIVDELPLGSIIYPKELCCNTIVRYVRAMQNQAGAAISVHAIAGGQLEAVEFLVDETTAHCGQPLREIKLKPNVLVVSINHGGRTEMPNGESCFRKGDTIVLVTSNRGALLQLNDIFA